jgi:hypothetical protein
MSDYRQSPLWKSAFAERDDGFNDQREKLAAAFAEFRERVSYLAGEIHKDMRDLTVHDISHIDALWWVASEIAGDDYPLNPAEAFVLGGAFLLHDAAHCVAAYPGGIKEIRALSEWQEFSAGIGAEELQPGTQSFQLMLFEVLRAMHPRQARKLPTLCWSEPDNSTPLYLLPHDELRATYGDVIGQLAESHWWSPHALESFGRAVITAPVCLKPASWQVDMLKLAVLLRTADAAHLDAERAPRFLLALVQPGRASLAHWQFQVRMSQVKRDEAPERHDLRLSASSFPVQEQAAWWLAYDAARLIDKELRAGDQLLLDQGRPRLAARRFSAASSPEDFARAVPTQGWQPVDAGIKISDVRSLVDRFGGEKLYGDEPIAALRELLQNAIDAVHACRKLGGLGEEEGWIEVAIENVPGGHWLHVTDTGIGMSRYVLTDVLLDFGRSLWRSGDLRGEWSGLRASGFEAIGQFGIGFFAVFMLGERVRVATRRYEAKEGESSQWLLDFPAGTVVRPVLRVPDEKEALPRHGTRVSVFMTEARLRDLCLAVNPLFKQAVSMTFAQTCAWLAPAADVDLYVRDGDAERECVVKANDWLTLSAVDLLRRIAPGDFSGEDPDRFGLWSHLLEIHREDGVVAGRCAVVQTNLWFRHGRLGVGVIKGLRAGEVNGLAGIVFTKPQTDLARRDAVPDICLLDLQRWAEQQKRILANQPRYRRSDEGAFVIESPISGSSELEEGISGLLAAIGASHPGLSLGNLAGRPASQEKLVAHLGQSTELLVVEGEVEYDEDDDVLPREFRDNFEPSPALLELTPVRVPDWLSQIDDGSISRDTWSLESVLQEALIHAWGEVVWQEMNREVGTVDYHSIMRKCRVATKSG